MSGDCVQLNGAQGGVESLSLRQDKLKNVDLALNEDQISAYKNKLKITEETISSFMETYSMSKEQIEAYVKMFFLFDKDCDGKVSVQDLGSWFGAIGLDKVFCVAAITPEFVVENAVNGMDSGNKGSFDFEEFVAEVQRKLKFSEASTEEEMRWVYGIIFQTCDKDGDGFVGAEDTRRIMEELGKTVADDDCQRVMKGVDIDGDGRVSKEDFVSWAMAFDKKYFQCD